MVDYRPYSREFEMIRLEIVSLTLLVAGLLLTSCSEAPDETAVISAPLPEIIDMAEDLAELKADFNTAIDQVRLVFIVGPT